MIDLLYAIYQKRRNRIPAQDPSTIMPAPLFKYTLTYRLYEHLSRTHSLNISRVETAC